MDQNGNYLSYEDLNIYSKTRTKKKTVFEFDENEIYELISHHGIASAICDALLG